MKCPICSLDLDDPVHEHVKRNHPLTGPLWEFRDGDGKHIAGGTQEWEKEFADRLPKSEEG